MSPIDSPDAKRESSMVPDANMGSLGAESDLFNGKWLVFKDHA